MIQSNEKIKNEVKFIPPQMVVLKSDPTKFGPIISVISGQPDLIQVFIDSKNQPFYASQLELYKEPNPHFLSAERFRAYLSAIEILQPGMSSLYSINSARVDFIPYQYRPVLRFIRADRPRMLIADSVGVGKTIEAGLILRELQARKDLNSILIICPRPLVTESKWKNEMKRFDEEFEHLDGDDLRFCISETYKDGVWPVKKDRVIISYSKFNKAIIDGDGKKISLNSLDPPPHFDLVIVDEAHHIRNTNTDAYKAVKYFCENAEAVLFLTATPIQLKSDDLFVLLNLLRPDLIIDTQSFSHMAEPNPFINNAVSAMREQNSEWQKKALELINKATETSWGKKHLINNPDFIKVKDKLSQSEISREDRVKIITITENLHTFSGIINRTRRRDIGDFTKRTPITIKIPFTTAQQKLHDSLLDTQAKIYKKIHGSKNIVFMMTTLRRQAASCIFGLNPYLKEMLTRYDDELFVTDLLCDAVDDTFDKDLDTSEIQSIKKEIEQLLTFAQELDDNDPKFDELKIILKEKITFENHRIMLFSSFRHTLYYLFKKLSENGFRVGLIHGGIHDDERVKLRNCFEKPKDDVEAIDILLFSEVGCEGLDYQFCDCMVNYDLPWNPMRIEQRIGRIDRKGQKSEAVVIYNMVTPGTVDFDIFDRCLMRIGVFEKSIGDCEEILGKITYEIKSIGDDFSLSNEERQKKLEILKDNELRLIQETEKLEEEKFNFIGLQLPQEQLSKEIENATNYYLSPVAIENLVRLYLYDVMGLKQEVILGKELLKTLRLSIEIRDLLLSDFRKLNIRRNELNIKWERWLQGTEQHLSITFDSDCAVNNPNKTVFLAPFHPLVRQAAHHFEINENVIVKLLASSNDIKSGDYPFAIYRWKYLGVRENQIFKTITRKDISIDNFELLLRDAVDIIEEDINFISEEIINEFNALHYILWDVAKYEHSKENQRIVEYQKQSLETSHNARISLLTESLRNNPDERIKRMRQSEIFKINADYERHFKELEEAVKRVDIKFLPIVYGVLRVKGGNDE